MNNLQQTLASISPVNTDIIIETQKVLDNLTKPPGSLGKLEELVKKIASIRNEVKPQILNKTIVNMAADHGVVAEGVSAFPQEVTPQMVHNFVNGGAAINVLSRQAGAKLILVDIGVASDLSNISQILHKKIAYGTQNMCIGPAMSESQAIQALEIGIDIAKEAIKQGSQIIGLGEMGIGNTTPSAAIAAVFTEMDLHKITGRGTGVDDIGLNKKVAAIKKALELNKPDKSNALDVLAKVGGFEIGGLAGIIIGAAANKVPVIIDGFISAAAAMIAINFNPLIKGYLIASHLSVEPGHKIILDYLELEPMLLMDMRLGEGTGAALAMQFVDSAINIVNEMATFASAGISGAEA